MDETGADDTRGVEGAEEKRNRFRPNRDPFPTRRDMGQDIYDSTNSEV